MFVWYLGFRWTYLAREAWLFNPINFCTAIVSIIFIVPTLISIKKSYYKLYYYLAIFLLFRNLYYTAEDVIDMIHFPSDRQFIYIIVDLIMSIYASVWMINYYKKDDKILKKKD